MVEMLADKPYDHRVREGKKREVEISRRLREVRHSVQEVTAKEDMHDKIDAVVDGRKAQYKFRETGTDILFDYAEPFTGRFRDPGTRLGRDLVSKAEMYVVLVGQRLWMAEKRAIVEAANRLLILWFREDGGVSTRYEHRSVPGVQLQWNADHSSGRSKLIFFLSPSSVGAVEIT